MTFIASVIAKKGVALIADSLVTQEMAILSYHSFIEYLENAPKNDAGEATLNADDITNLFSSHPMFTRDYEEKLFKLTKFIGLTTTGIAYINDKNISEIVENFKNLESSDIKNDGIDFETRLKQFSKFLNEEVRGHLGKYNRIGFCSFIATHYAPPTHITTIYKVIVNPASVVELGNEAHDFVTLQKQEEWAKVVCDGQNKISENVLYGSGKTFYDNFPNVVKHILTKANVDSSLLPKTFLADLINDPFFEPMFYGDVEITNLSELSVQQAVDLASLLMRLEVDFQKYTRTMPTVGGVIKLAVIDEKGFRVIQGDTIESPKHIHL